MVHRELLTVVLVCCLGLSMVAAQPALAGDDSDVSLFGDDSDGLSHEDSEEETAEDEGTRDGSDAETDSDDGDGESEDSGDDGWSDQSDDESDDENSSWRESSDDDRRWGGDSDDESDDENGSDYRGGMGDSEHGNESDRDSEDEDTNRTNGSGAGDPDEQMDGSSGDAAEESDEEGDAQNSSASANETDRFLLDDVADALVGVADVTPNGTADATDAGADETGERSGDARGLTIDRGGDGAADDATLGPAMGLDRRLSEGDLDETLGARGTVDGMSAFVSTAGERGAVAGAERLVTYVGSESALLSGVVAVLAEPTVEEGDDRLSTDDGGGGTADGEALRPRDRTATLDSSNPVDPSVDGASDDETADEAEAAGGSSGGDGGEGPSGAPAGGAALLMFVGYLGGGRLALNQTAMLASMSQSNLLGSLQQSIGQHLGGLPDRVVPPVFGYSRHDDSDPLENETRARIYDLVRDSPGMYYAQLAEETDVTVETVRYHCRILADEGLVERRKLRGRQRLYPVTMGDDDPELAAAIADSAASDVLSAIERREPTTLSSVAEAIGCAPSTVSYHLDRLEEDGLVSRERDGGSVRIRLRRATKSALQGSVADD